MTHLMRARPQCQEINSAMQHMYQIHRIVNKLTCIVQDQDLTYGSAVYECREEIPESSKNGGSGLGSSYTYARIAIG